LSTVKQRHDPIHGTTRCPLCDREVWIALKRVRRGDVRWVYLDTFAGADALTRELSASPEATLRRVGVVGDNVHVVEDDPAGKFLEHDCFRQDPLPHG
jgi:hypothetical protein